MKSLVLNNDVIELLAARVTNAWERPPWAADRFFERNEIAIVQQSSAPDGVVCVFADLAYLRAFGADLLRSFGEAHRRSQIGLHVHVYRTTVDDLARFIEDSRMPPGPWLELSIDSASAPIYRHRRNLPSFFITARFIIVDRLLQLYRPPLTMIDADVEVRRDLAGFFDSMRSYDVGLIIRGDDKQAWRCLLAAAVFANNTAGARQFVHCLADCIAGDIWGDVPFSLDALYLHFCHRAALAHGEIRFGRIPMSMSDHSFAANSWIWHRKGERKRVGASAPPIESGKA